MPTDWTRRTSLSPAEVELLRSLDFETDELDRSDRSADPAGGADRRGPHRVADDPPGSRRIVRIAAAAAAVVVAMMAIILLSLPPVVLLAVLAAAVIVGAREPARPPSEA